MFGSTKKLEQRVESLENTLGRLERGFQNLELEWVNAYGKFRKIAARIAKDQAVIDSKEAQRGEEDPTTTSPTQSENGGGVLSPRQKTLQQQILRRRAGHLT